MAASAKQTDLQGDWVVFAHDTSRYDYTIYTYHIDIYDVYIDIYTHCTADVPKIIYMQSCTYYA